MTSEPHHLDFSFASSCLLPVMPSFVCFSGHHASVKTSDLNHKRCHLHLSHLDHGNVLFTPTRYLPEIIYLQVQVRWTSREQPGGLEDLDRWKLEPPLNLRVTSTKLLCQAVSLLPSHPVASRPVPILCTFFFCFFFSSFLLNTLQLFLVVLCPFVCKVKAIAISFCHWGHILTQTEIQNHLFPV